jgi:hypothetical protein
VGDTRPCLSQLLGRFAHCSFFFFYGRLLRAVAQHVDLYMFPDPKAGNPAGQVNALVAYLNSNNIHQRTTPPRAYRVRVCVCVCVSEIWCLFSWCLPHSFLDRRTQHTHTRHTDTLTQPVPPSHIRCKRDRLIDAQAHTAWCGWTSRARSTGRGARQVIARSSKGQSDNPVAAAGLCVRACMCVCVCVCMYVCGWLSPSLSLSLFAFLFPFSL